MNKYRPLRPAPLFAAILWLFAFSSSTLPARDTTDPAIIRQVDSITILPIVFPATQTAEDREETLESLYGPLDDYIYKALLRKLAMKGYVLDKPRGWTRPGDWSVERLQGLSPAALASLAPETAEHVAFLFVDRLEASNRLVQSSASASISAMILDRPHGTLVWQGSDDGKFSENILFSGMLLTPDKHAAVEKAFVKLFAELPEKSY